MSAETWLHGSATVTRGLPGSDAYVAYSPTLPV